MRCLAIVIAMTGSAAAEPLSGDVQVWQDARLYLAPSARAESFTLATLDQPRDERTGATFQMHVVGESGDFVELAKLGLGDYADKCHFWGELEIDARIEGMRLFVRRDDLAAALVKPWSHAFHDGTSVALAPGTPVGPSTTGGRVIALSAGHGEAPAKLVADLPADSIGLSFMPSKRQSSSEGWPWQLTTRAVTVGGQTLVFDHDLPLLMKITPRGDRALVPFETDCAELVASVPRKQVGKSQREAGMYGSLTAAAGQGAELPMLVPRGTPLATPAGHRVGVAAFDLPTAATTSAQACLELDLAIAGSRAARPTPGKLVLCAPSQVLVTRPLPRPPPEPSPRARTPIVEHGHATSSGGLDEASIRRVVRRSSDAFVACYATSLAKAPDLQGTLTLSFTIGADGSVGQATGSGLDAVSVCPVAAIRKARFPKPTGVVQVEYPVMFRN